MGGLNATNIFAPTDRTLARLSSVKDTMDTLKAGLDDKKMKQIDASSKDFEAMYISEMLGHMFNSVPVDSEFGGGQAEETWRSMMVQEYGKKISEAGGIGISDDIKAKMIEMQEAMQK